MQKKTKKVQTNNGSAEVFDQRPVTGKDIKQWCKNVKGKNNGIIVTIPNFCCGQTVSLGGAAITTNRIGGTLEIQVCTDDSSPREYKIVSDNKYSKSGIALEKI